MRQWSFLKFGLVGWTALVVFSVGINVLRWPLASPVILLFSSCLSLTQIASSIAMFGWKKWAFVVYAATILIKIAFYNFTGAAERIPAMLAGAAIPLIVLCVIYSQYKPRDKDSAF